jgi:hypothetical protein
VRCKWFSQAGGTLELAIQARWVGDWPDEDEDCGDDDQDWSNVRQACQVVTNRRPSGHGQGPHASQEKPFGQARSPHASRLTVGQARFKVTILLRSTAPHGLQVFTLGEHAGSRRSTPLLSPICASRFNDDEPEKTMVHEMIWPRTPCWGLFPVTCVLSVGAY